MNETLTPDDAVDVLEGLLPAQNKSYELGLKLKLPQHVVEAIHSKQLPPDKYLLKVLIKFLQQVEPRPTWRVIVEALRSPAVNLPALAKRVEAAYFPDPTATRDVTAETTGMSPSAPLISDWCSHVSIISDTESAANSTASDDEVKSKPPSQLVRATGKVTWFVSCYYNIYFITSVETTAVQPPAQPEVGSMKAPSATGPIQTHHKLPYSGKAHIDK